MRQRHSWLALKGTVGSRSTHHDREVHHSVHQQAYSGGEAKSLSWLAGRIQAKVKERCEFRSERLEQLGADSLNLALLSLAPVPHSPMKIMKKDFPLMPNMNPKFLRRLRVIESMVFHHISSYVNSRSPKRIM